MAYGMLTSFALGAAQGLGGAIVNKLSKDQDAEIKAKADAEREARIEEAAIRSENRAVTREQSIYERNQADKTLETGAQHQWTVDTEKRAAAEKLVEEQRKQDYENDPNTLAGQAKIAQINAANTSNQSQQLELQTKSEVLKAGSEWENAKTDEERRAAENRIKALTGKVGDTVEFKTSTDIIGYDKNDKPITKTTMNWVDTRNRTVTPVEGTSSVPLTDKKLREEANARANAVGGTNYKGYQDIKTGWIYDTDAEKEEYRKKEEFNKVYTETLANGGKAPAAEKTQGGMLNSKTTDKTTDKAIEQAVKTATANPLIKFTDDPVKQGQFDTITGVLLYSESGLKGANVGRPKATPNNPHPTADGSYQLTNIAMKDLNIKPDLPNGEYSVEAKEKAAPDFYKKAYNATQGDASAFLAYRFSPPDIKQAVEKAKKEGGNWWDYAKSDLTKANMPTVIRDAERTMMQLARENKRVPLEISKIILANR
jgi:hypothetical protein